MIGQTVVQRQGPPRGWTDAERAELALYLSESVTDPAAKPLRPGSLMVWWAVDLAARRGVPWVRRYAQVSQVAAYGQAQGFTLVGTSETWIAPPEVRNPARATAHRQRRENMATAVTNLADRRNRSPGQFSTAP